MADINYESIIEELTAVNSMTNLEELKDLAIRTLEASESCDLKTQADIREKLESGLEDVVNQYTSESKLAMYRAIGADDDPMRRAVSEYFYETIRVKETKNKKLKCTIREIADGRKSIDLIQLNKWIKEHTDYDGIGRDARWITAFTRLNVNMAKDAATRYGDDTTKNRLMDPTNLRVHKEVLEFTFETEEALGAIDQIIKMMIGEEYSADQKDYELIHDTYVSNDKGSATAVKLSNDRAFAEILKKVCYRKINSLPNYIVTTKLLNAIKN